MPQLTAQKPGLNKLNSSILGFKRQANGQINVLTANDLAVGSRISFIGYNDVYNNWYSKYGDKSDTSSSYANPAYLTQKLLGYGNHNDPRYASPVKANCRRVYLPTTNVVTSFSQKASYAPAVVQIRDRKNFLFYIDQIWDLNLTFTDVTAANVTVTWRSDIVTANGSTDNLKLNGFRPQIVCEGANGNAFAKAGRAYGIEASSNVFPELPSNDVTGITVTITANGSGMQVGGVTQASYVLPANKLKVAKFAAQSYSLISGGYGKRITAKNKGVFGIDSKVPGYEYIQYVDGNYNNDISSPLKFLGPQIAGRIGKNSLRCLTNSGADFYSEQNENWGENEYSYIADLHCFAPAQNCPKDCSTISSRFYSQGFFTTWAKGDYSGDQYYDPQGEVDPNAIDSVQGAKVTQIDNYDLLMGIKEAYKYGVFTFLNAFWSFQNYNYSAYSTSGVLEYNKKRLEAEAQYMQAINKFVRLVIDQIGFCPLILGNETNLNLQGTFYGTYPGVNTGDYIYFADIDNQTRQANVNAMMSFFNKVAGQLKMTYGDKVLVGPSIQMGNSGQVNEILTAVSLGFASNFDCLFNNYYGAGSTANPYVSFDGSDPMAYYKAQLDANPTWKKLNLIFSECGMPGKNLDLNNIPAGYNKTGQKGYIAPFPNTTNYTSTYVEQGQVASNLITQGLVNSTRNQYIQGLIFFADGDQPNRLSLEEGYGVSAYSSFFVPPTNAAFVSNTDTQAQVTAFNANPNTTAIPNGKLHIWSEEWMSHLWKNYPRVYDPAASNKQQSTEFLDDFTALSTRETNAMQATRTAIATGVPDLKYANQI